MNAARIMWIVSTGVALLNIATSGCGSVTFPSTMVNPCGSFIQALAVTTKNAEATPAIATGMPLARCRIGLSRSQACR